MLGRGVGSVQAGALAPQVPSVYARSYIRLDPILHRLKIASPLPSGKSPTRKVLRRPGYVSNYVWLCLPEFDRKQFKLTRIHSLEVFSKFIPLVSNPNFRKLKKKLHIYRDSILIDRRDFMRTSIVILKFANCESHDFVKNFGNNVIYFKRFADRFNIS